MSATLSARAGAMVTLFIIILCLGCRLLDAEQSSAVAIKILTATLVVGVVPGLLVTILWRPRPQLTTLEAIGFGMAVSFGLVQLLTVLAITVHVGVVVTLTILVVGSAAMAAGVLRRPSTTLVISLDDVIVLSLLLMLGVFLYDLGSPVDWFEDQMHVAIVRRLSALESPRLDNVYFAPGIVYAYPFPGTHYFMALIARLSDLDPLFVYHKLRFFWGPAALVMLHLSARAVFGSRAIACAVVVTAIAFVCNGAFAMVPGFPSGWGQLIPYSHASDVAMTVLLPALLVVAFEYLLSGSARERNFFLTATAMLVLVLTIIHIREVVQFSAYIGCFLVVTLASRGLRDYAWRTAALLVLVLVIAITYSGWQAGTVTLVSDIMGDQRARLGTIAATSSLWSLVFTPAQALLGDFVANTDQLFVGIIPLILFTGPAVMLLFRRQPLMWLLSSSTIVYLAVMTVPLLAIPYIYLTYFEILYTPVRNVIFFAYLFGGAAIYAMVVALERFDRTLISLLVAGTFMGAVAVLVSLCLNSSAGGLVAPLIGSYGLAFLVLCGGPLSGRRMGLRTSVAALMVTLGLVALWPERPPTHRVTDVSVRWAAGLPDEEREALEQRFSLTSGEFNSNHSADVNVWNYSLEDPTPDNLRALVTHPQVVDTNDIDRDAFTVPSRPPPSDHPYLSVEHVTLLQYPGALLFLAAAVFVWGVGFLVPTALASARGRQAAEALHVSMSEPFYTRALPYALFMIPLALFSARPTLSPLPVGAETPRSVGTPREMITQMPCVTLPQRPAPFSDDIFGGEVVVLPAQKVCPPDYALLEWAHERLPVDAVLAINRWNPNISSVFMPQQVVVFPLIEVSFIDEHELFGTYYQFYDERMESHRVQPFFNSVETPAERAAFVKALAVTHVLVDPMYYDEMRSVLDGLPEQFTLRYANARWAVYEVVRTSLAGARGV